MENDVRLVAPRDRRWARCRHVGGCKSKAWLDWALMADLPDRDRHGRAFAAETFSKHSNVRSSVLRCPANNCLYSALTNPVTFT